MEADHKQDQLAESDSNLSAYEQHKFVGAVQPTAGAIYHLIISGVEYTFSNGTGVLELGDSDTMAVSLQQYFPDEYKTYALSSMCAKVYTEPGGMVIRNFDAGCFETGIGDYDQDVRSGQPAEIPFYLRHANDPYLKAWDLTDHSLAFDETNYSAWRRNGIILISVSVLIIGGMVAACQMRRRYLLEHLRR